MSGQNGPPDLSELAGVQKTHASDPTNARPSPHISQVNYSPVWPDGGILLVAESVGASNAICSRCDNPNPMPHRFLAFIIGPGGGSGFGYNSIIQLVWKMCDPISYWKK